MVDTSAVLRSVFQALLGHTSPEGVREKGGLFALSPLMERAVGLVWGVVAASRLAPLILRITLAVAFLAPSTIHSLRD
jgi:hypothetical protein